MTTGEIRLIEEPYFLNGEERWVETVKVPYHDHTGKTIGVMGIFTDITKRRLAEQVQRRLATAIEQAAESVVITDVGGNILYVNPASERITGYSKEELIGFSPGISQGPATDLREIKKLNEAIKNKVPCEIEVINYTRLGRQYWVSQSSSPISNADGEVTHWISIQRDITQNRKHLQEIEDQNKKFREIAWIQSHIVRAPLARVMALVDLLGNFTPGDDKDELLLHLTNSAKELDTIIINIADKTP